MKHPFLTITIALAIVGLILGLSATDVFQYFTDIVKSGVTFFVAWLNEIILAIRDAFQNVTGAAPAV